MNFVRVYVSKGLSKQLKENWTMGQLYILQSQYSKWLTYNICSHI